MADDPLQTIIDLLSDNWNPSNTDNKTPKFIKITDLKRYDWNNNQDLIALHRSLPQQEHAGTGALTYNEFTDVKIDIRTFGQTQEEHWYGVIAEVNRILRSKIKLLDGTYDILEPLNEETDLSDKTHNMWRLMKRIKLKKFARSI